MISQETDNCNSTQTFPNFRKRRRYCFILLDRPSWKTKFKQTIIRNDNDKSVLLMKHSCKTPNQNNKLTKLY